MRLTTSATAALIVLVTCGSALLSAQVPIWAEEFNGPTLDTSTWTYDVGGSGFGNQELQFYSARPENVSIQNGSLVITARRESYSGKLFTSARLKTHGRLAFRYGHLEARVKIPNLQNGLWPAFWLLGQNIGQQTWPKCGEVDILEMGHKDAITAGVVNRRVFAAAHWDYNNSYASYGNNLNVFFNLNDAYHTYALDWTPQMLTASLDGAPFWQMGITDPNASLEEFHQPMFIVLNLAVGGINFVQITDPAQITAPFPAPMYIDYLRLYDNGYTELTRGADTAETGNFGVFTEATPVNNAVAYGIDSELYIWNNLTIAATGPFEGAEVWNCHANAGNWFGMGVFCLADRNMSNYADGALHFHMKTTSSHTFGVGIASSAAGEGWISLTATGEQFGLVRDGQWHEVVIPAARFGNVDYATIKQIFMIKGEAPAAACDFALDNVYWTPSVPRPAPQNGSFGVFTENPAHMTAGEAVLGLDQDFYIWENTLITTTPHPYEGTTCFALTSTPGLNWFGAALTPRVKYNLSAFRYPTSRLHCALKTTSTQTFQIGMKSGTVNDIGQRWITFASGADPYGFVRDGQWHVVEIPMSDFGGVDLTDISQFFELLGTAGPITNIEIDDVCFLDGGTALVPGGAGDLTGDGYVAWYDFLRWAPCLVGPGVTIPPPTVSAVDFAHADLNADDDVDLADFAAFQVAYTGGN
jgi:beta-glucanase (GH16 family)